MILVAVVGRAVSKTLTELLKLGFKSCFSILNFLGKRLPVYCKGKEKEN